MTARLRAAIHMESAAIAPRTSQLIEAAKESVVEIERLQEALRDAHKLIDNDIVIPWIIRHKLDDILLGKPSPSKQPAVNGQ